MEKIIIEIEQGMINFLDNKEMEELHRVLTKSLRGLTITKEQNEKIYLEDDVDYCEMFIYAKKVEGCSEKTIKYYKATISTMLKLIQKPVKHITTDDLRKYLGDYNKNNNRKLQYQIELFFL